MVKIFFTSLAQTTPPYFRLLVVIRQGILLYFIQAFLQVAPKLLLHLLSQVLRITLTIVQQELHILFAGVGMLVDEGVELRLGELGIIALVVAMAAVAHHVNKDI